MAALSIRSPGLKSLGISVLLLLIFLQTLLLYYVGVFICSDEVLIGPGFFSQNSQYHVLPYSRCERRSRYGPYVQWMFEIVILLCFYAPVVLVAFALLSMLLAAYAKDKTTLKCSMACQAVSSLLTLGGIMFLLWFRSYLSWKDMTPCFYMCVGVEVQLIITTVLTRLLGQALTSDWE